MKLVHVVPHISEEASGPSYSVPRLCQALASLGEDVELSCLAAANRDLGNIRLDVHPQWPILRRFAVSPSLARSLAWKAERVDIIHNHSLWSMVNVAAGWTVPGKHAKLVTSPRGTLSAWALSNSKWIKRAIWPLQMRALTRADLLHATSEVERHEIRARGFKAPIAVIPNGIDLPVLEKRRKDGFRTLLFLSRIHPTKGIDRLLHAWRELQVRQPEWRLIVVGRGEPGYEQELKGLAASLELERVVFAGPRYGASKSKTYFEADLFVLPTHSENFGMVVAEALAHGCPAVVSRGAPWAGLESESCGWWVDHDVPELIRSLDAAMSVPRAGLTAMGLNGRAWMQRDFSWETVARRMDTAYRWAVGRGELPAWVHLD